MDKEAIERYAEEKGFSLWAVINGGKALQFMDDRGINLIVYTDNLNYEFQWKIPYSLFKICSEQCSPFGSEHFDKMLSHFRVEVQFRKFQEG